MILCILLATTTQNTIRREVWLPVQQAGESTLSEMLEDVFWPRDKIQDNRELMLEGKPVQMPGAIE
jgi:hypothetical protein